MDVYDLYENIYPNVNEFWCKIFDEYDLKCTICESKIIDVNSLICYDCECNNFYHNKCHYNYECVCDEHSIIKINFLCKILSKKEYVEMYYKTILKIKYNISKIIFYSLWFENNISNDIDQLLCLVDYNSKNDILLNPYEYNINFDQNRYKSNYNYLIKTNNEFNDNAIKMLNTEIKLSNINEFNERLQYYSYGMIMSNEFPWHNSNFEGIFLVGQSVLICLNSNIDIPDINHNIELIISYKKTENIKHKLTEILNFYKTKYNDDNIFYIVINNIILIYIKGFKRCIQITLIKNTIDNILNQFEFTCLQSIYDGKRIYSNMNAIKYYGSKISFIISIPISTNLFNDLNKLGIIICYSKLDQIVINNLICKDQWYPSYYDTLDNVKNYLSKEFNIKTKYITQYNIHKIRQHKIPQFF